MNRDEQAFIEAAEFYCTKYREESEQLRALATEMLSVLKHVRPVVEGKPPQVFIGMDFVSATIAKAEAALRVKT